MRGWRQGGDTGRLWMPNELVSITDSFNQLDNTSRLITSVRTQLAAGSGSTTVLTVMPKAAFDLLAQPETSGGAV